MFVRINRVALALSVALPPIAAAQGFEYAAGTAQYRVTQKVHAIQEAMGQKQEIDNTVGMIVSTKVDRPSKDTLLLTSVLDSVSVSSPMGVMPGMDRLMGLKVVTKLSPAGVKYSAVGATDDSIPGASQFVEGLSTLLPKIRSMTKGATWTDTTTGKIKQGGLDLDRREIATYTFAGDTTVGAEKAYKINRDGSQTMSGSGAAQGQAMTMEGTANTKAVFVVSQKGVLLGGEGTEDSAAKIVLAANGMEVGITRASTLKLEKLK